jgi:hypothetical protein
MIGWDRGLSNLRIVYNPPRRTFAEFKLWAHFLEAHNKRFNVLLLLGVCCFLLCNHTLELSDSRLLLLYFAMLFDEFVEQHRVHRFVAHGISLAVRTASD